MSPVSGWRYFKLGQCPDCHDAQGSLRVPVLDGVLTTSGGREVIQGQHLPHFAPVCTSCSEKYSLDVLCEVHKYPLRTVDARCKLCPK